LLTFQCLCLVWIASPAQEAPSSALDELVESMSANEALAVQKVATLPQRLHGQLIAIAQFNDESQQWDAMAGPQDFGVAAADKLVVLGYEAGQDGFVEARYITLTDRVATSYTAITDDSRMSISLYDDDQDSEHVILSLRIGPRQLRYLLQRP